MRRMHRQQDLLRTCKIVISSGHHCANREMDHDTLRCGSNISFIKTQPHGCRYLRSQAVQLRRSSAEERTSRLGSASRRLISSVLFLGTIFETCLVTAGALALPEPMNDTQTVLGLSLVWLPIAS